MANASARKKQFLKNVVKLRPCAVCEAESTGYHFGVFSCEACKSFFRRSIKRQGDIICARHGNCNIKFGTVKGSPCSACRIKRCLEVGMSLSAVKMGRYSLEKRAETIKDSREYWNNSTNNVAEEQCVPVSESQLNGARNLKDTTASNCETAQTDSIVRSMLLSPRKTDVSTATSGTSSSEITTRAELTAITVDLKRTSDQDVLETPITTSPGQQDSFTTHNIPSGVFIDQNSLEVPIDNHAIELLRNIETSEVEMEDSDNGIIHAHNDNVNWYIAKMVNASGNINETSCNIPLCQIENPETRSSTGFSIVCDEEQSVKDFLKCINSPVSELDEALGNEDDDSTLDKLIEQTIDAFDKQNFMTRGYVAKLPHYQHKFMMERRERERLFGPMKPLSIIEHKEFMENTGIDLDGRLEEFEKFVRCTVVPTIKKVAMYITSLPGVKTLPLEDQFSLLKYSKGEYNLTTRFTAFNVRNKLVTLGATGHTMDYDDLLVYYSKEAINGFMEAAAVLQNLSLTDHEYAMMSAVTTIKPDACVTEEGKAKCSIIRERLFSALERLLYRRSSPRDARELLSVIRTIVERINEGSDMYNMEWDRKYLEHSHVKWPRFITDLIITTPTPSPDIAAATEALTQSGNGLEIQP